MMRGCFIILILLYSYSMHAQTSVCCAPMDSCHMENDVHTWDSLFALRLPGALTDYNKSDNVKSKKKAHLIRIWGQSNAGGQAPNSGLNSYPIANIPRNFRLPFNRVYIQNNLGQFISLQLAVNNKKNDTSQFGAEIAIAYRYKLAFPNEDLFIAKFFKNNSSITLFTPTSSFYNAEIKYFDSLAKIYWANNNWDITDDGVLWQQGESDKQQTRAWYELRLDSIYTAAKTDGFYKSYSKFLISLLAPTSATYGTGVDSAFRHFAALHPDVKLINPPATPLQSDSIHLTATGEFMVGYKAAELWWDLDSMGVYNNSKSMVAISSINGVPTTDGNIVLTSAGNGQLIAAKAYTDSVLAAVLPKYLKDDSVRTCSGVLYYTRSNGINTWHVKERRNLKDSCVISGNFIDVYFASAGRSNLPMGAIAGNGNITNGVVPNYTSGAQYQLALNGISPGARMLDDNRIRVNLSQMMEMQLMVTYDSFSNTFQRQQLQPSPVNLQSSYPPVITSGQDGKGHLWIRINTAGVFKPVKFPDIKDAKYDVLVEGQRLVLVPNSSEDNKFTVKDANGNYINGPIPPNNSVFIINWGTVNGFVNPATVDLANGEISLMGQYKMMN